jgi:hypothetical protein
VGKLKAIIDSGIRSGIDKPQPPRQMPDEAARQAIRPTKKTIDDFSNEDSFYRIVDEDAYIDLVNSGAVRTNFGNKPGSTITDKLASRPTRYPSFSKGSANKTYAEGKPNHYIIETKDPSIKPSTEGRHGKGTTQFPTDSTGVHLESLPGEAVQVYRHIGDGQYRLVYDQGKVTPNATNAETKVAAPLGIISIPIAAAIAAGTMTPQEAQAGPVSKALAELAKRADAGDEAARQGIRGYHGSPHDFPPVRELEMPDGAVVYQSMDDAVPEGARVIKEHPLGRFDMSKIGTGEGAQAYSRGLYFAEREATGQSYRDTLSRDNLAQRAKDNQSYDTLVGLGLDESPELGAFSTILSEADGDMARAIQDSMTPRYPDDPLPAFAQSMADAMKSGRLPASIELPTLNKGSMYEVKIDATPDEFIDWDLPLDEQSESVMNALNKTDWYKYAEEGAYEAAGNRGDNPYGMDLVRWLEEDGAEDAVQMLKDAGIKGVQYADAQTRFGKGPKTKNYVVYDDKLIDIIKKYGVSVPIAVYIAEGIITPEEAQAGFIGPTSKIFINEAANLAKSMDAAGNTRDEIWKATGEQFGAPMLKGPEGVWKQEISDQGNYIPAEQEAGLRQGRTPTFGAALQGPDGPSSMVEAYPRLQDSRITPIVSDTTRGSFDPRSGDIRLSTGDSLVNRSNQEMASTLQHEGQHFIQEQENWAKGGNPEHSARMLDAAKRDLVEAQEKAQSVRMQYEDKLEELGYRNAIDLSRTASKLSEVDRLKGYLDGYYNGGKLTDKRRHILNSGGIMDPNAEYRMRRGINWAKRHRPQAERDQNYADYIQGVIAAVEKDMDPQLVEQVRNSGVKNPYAKYQREISNARAKAQEAFGVDMETWNGTVAEMNQFVNRYERGGGEKLYRDLAGEVEARTVQERLPMSMDERVASPPWEGKEWTETPPENQVFIDDYGRLATATMGGALAALAGSANASGGGLGSLPAATKKAMAESVKQAKEQGYDLDNVMYHASKQDIEEFVPGYSDGLVFLTPNKEFANDWLGKGKFQERQGGTGSIEGVRAEKKRFMEEANNVLKSLPKDQRQQYFEEILNPQQQQLIKDERLADSAIYPVVTRTKKPFVPSKDVDVLEELYGKEYLDAPFGSGFPTYKDALKDGNYLLYENKEVVDFLKSKGYDSMFLKESSGADKPFTTLAVFDPNNIRSVNAKFDPEKKDSPQILASAPFATGITGLGAMAALPSEEAQAGVISTLGELAKRADAGDEVAADALAGFTDYAFKVDGAPVSGQQWAYRIGVSDDQGDLIKKAVYDARGDMVKAIDNLDRMENAGMVREPGLSRRFAEGVASGKYSDLLTSRVTSIGKGAGISGLGAMAVLPSEEAEAGGMGVTSRAMPDEVAFKAPREPRRIPPKQPPGIASLAGQLGLGAMSEIAGAILGGLAGAAEYGRGSGPSMGGMAGAPATAESIRNINEGVSGYVGDLYDAGPEAQALGQQIMQGIGETIAPIAEYAMEGPITDEYGINMLPLLAQKLGIPLYELLERVYSMMPELEQEAAKSGADAFL